jgi:hypothetical protein
MVFPPMYPVRALRVAATHLADIRKAIWVEMENNCEMRRRTMDVRLEFYSHDLGSYRLRGESASRRVENFTSVT